MVNEGNENETGNENDSNGNAAEGGYTEDSKIAALQAEVADLKDKYLRSLAEFENFRKRTIKERSELIKYQGEKIIADLLDVSDNLERAVEGSQGDLESLREGLPLIYKGFIDTLGKWEIRSESATGKPFDPAKHRALSKVAVNDAPPGTVIREFRKTFFYKDKLLRPGEVVVAAGNEAGE